VSLISAFLSQVDALIAADANELSQIARYLTVKAAVERYSVDRPHIHADDVTGNATRYYELSVILGNWVEGQSRVLGIEYPAAVIASNGYPVYLEPRDWQDDYWAVDKRYLFLPNHSPAATETIRISYSVPWAWTASSTTETVNQAAHGFAEDDYLYLDTDSSWEKALDARLGTHQVTAVAEPVPPAEVSGSFTVAMLEANTPAQHFGGICYLAASLCCQSLAAKYAKGSDSTINADSVSRVTNSGEFSRRAAEFVKLYEQAIGQGRDITPPRGTGEFVDLETMPGYPGSRRYIYHGRRTHHDTGRRP